MKVVKLIVFMLIWRIIAVKVGVYDGVRKLFYYMKLEWIEWNETGKLEINSLGRNMLMK